MGLYHFIKVINSIPIKKFLLKIQVTNLSQSDIMNK